VLYMTERELRTPYVVSEGRCDHSHPIMVTPTGAGSYYASCLACLTNGPKRSSSWAAYRALKAGVNRLHQDPSPSLFPHHPLRYRGGVVRVRGSLE
jgi:hypothetical protein